MVRTWLILSLSHTHRGNFPDAEVMAVNKKTRPDHHDPECHVASRRDAARG